jgi:hypothetical protein
MKNNVSPILPSGAARAGLSLASSNSALKR